MQYIDPNTELTPEWVYKNDAFNTLVVLYNGLKVSLSEVTEVRTGRNGSVTFIDSPDPKIEGDDLVHHTLSGCVVAYIEDVKEVKETSVLDKKYGLLTIRYHMIIGYGLALLSAAAGVVDFINNM